LSGPDLDVALAAESASLKDVERMAAQRSKWQEEWAVQQESMPKMYVGPTPEPSWGEKLWNSSPQGMTLHMVENILSTAYVAIGGGEKVGTTLTGDTIVANPLTGRDMTRGDARFSTFLFVGTLPFGGEGAEVRAGQEATVSVRESVQEIASHFDAAAVANRVEPIADPSGQAYSVAFETKLDPASYPGLSRGSHFQEANESLLTAMEGDPEFARMMQDLGIDVQRTPTGLAPRTSPSEWTWHHAQDPGLMQLVPREHLINTL
jgi:hypothetical protein